MSLLYLIFVFMIAFIFLYKLLYYFKIKLFVSNFTVSILVAIFFTKVIHYNFIKLDSKAKNSGTEIKELLVGVSPDYAPYAFMENNAIVGFDIDLLELIANKLNLKLKLLAMPFHSILVALQLNNIMVAASGLSGTTERAKQMLISTSYFKNDYLCAVSLKKNSFNSIEELKDKKIIINTGYSSENYLKKLNLDSNLLKLKSVSDALLALNLGHGDVFITSYNSLVQLLKVKESDKFFIFVLPDNQENEEHLSFLLNKNNTSLLNDINSCIDLFLSDGTIKNLITKWGLE